MKTHILVIDDDPRICKLLEVYLKRELFEVSKSLTAKDALLFLENHQPDLIILDLILPDTDSMSFLKTLRLGFHYGILVVSGKSDPIDKIIFLELGADDYVTKPFDLRELLARIRTLLRRTHNQKVNENTVQQDNNFIFFSGFKMDIYAHELYTEQGELIELTHNEFTILKILAQNPHKVLTREQLIEAISDRDWSVYDRSIDVLIGKIRKKIEKDSKSPKLIKTIRGVGYKFIKE